MYYVLSNDTLLNIVGTVHDDNAFGLTRFTDGTKLPPDNQPLNLRVTVEFGPDVYPDYFELQGSPVVSRRFVDALRSVGVHNFDAYPVMIEESQRKIDGYAVLNIIGRISCVDEQNTDASKDEGQIIRIRSLAIDESRAHEQDLFRLHEKESVILISERVQGALEGFTGAIIKPAQGWTDRDRY